MNKSVDMIGLDITPWFMHEDAIPYIASRVRNETSDNYKETSFDLVFIDGDHSYESVMADYNNIGKYAKMCALHDINEPSCPDVIAAWSKITSNTTKNIKEFTMSVGNQKTHGIGVIFDNF